jgi:hypothetical protein
MIIASRKALRIDLFLWCMTLMAVVGVIMPYVWKASTWRNGVRDMRRRGAMVYVTNCAPGAVRKLLTDWPLPLWNEVCEFQIHRADFDDDQLRKFVAAVGMSHLDCVDLSETSISDAGVEHLLPAQHLKWINLSGTRVTELAIRRLEGLPELETVLAVHTRASELPATNSGKRRRGPAITRFNLIGDWRNIRPAFAAVDDLVGERWRYEE